MNSPSNLFEETIESQEIVVVQEYAEAEEEDGFLSPFFGYKQQNGSIIANNGEEFSSAVHRNTTTVKKFLKQQDNLTKNQTMSRERLFKQIGGECTTLKQHQPHRDFEHRLCRMQHQVEKIDKFSPRAIQSVIQRHERFIKNKQPAATSRPRSPE